MKPWNDIKYVNKFPIASAPLFCFGGLANIYHIWSTKTANGQSILGWAMLTLAVMMIYQFNKVLIPNEKLAQYACLLEALIYTGVIFSIVRFQ